MCMLGRTLGLLVAALLAVGTLAMPALAQTGEERIDRYDVDLTIERDGSLLVRERIDYDFGFQQRHGIFRDIPVRFPYDDTNDRIYPFELISIRGSAGTPVDVSEENPSGGIKRLKIGDPDQTITGRHSYTIAYRVEGTLNGFPDHDELYWNAIGTEWPVPIERAAVRVTAPTEITQTACFTGQYGGGLECARSESSGSTATFAHKGLFAFEGFTVVIAIPKGIVPEPKPILEQRWSLQRAFDISAWKVGGAIVLLVAIVGGVVALVWRNGRDQRFLGSYVDALHGSSTGAASAVPLFEDSPTVVEYAPPEEVRPGQIGTLIDEVANPLDVTATIVDLAVRGYLVIEEIPKEGWFGKTDWKLIRTKEPDDALLPYERRLHDGLFQGGDEVLLSELRTTFHERLSKVQDSLYTDVVKQGWFTVRPDKVRTRWRALSFLGFAAGLGALVAAIALTSLALLAVPLFVGGLVLLFSPRWMPRRTAKGTGMLRRVMGFRMLIETSEVELARFAERENLFSRFLPYAVVFGLTDKWAKAFEALGQQPDTTGWYHSPHPFTMTAFAYSVGGFTVATAGTIAARPAASGSSGFGGGGGFSGGGGGGGGGGSW